MKVVYKDPRAVGLFLVLLVLVALSGVYGSWWLVVVPAFFSGFIKRVPGVRIAMLSTISVWLLRALAADIPTGFRLSMRIAGVIGYPWSIVSYLAVCVLAAVLSGLAAQAGRGLSDFISDRGLRAAGDRASKRAG